jgi:predicted ATPase/class 3 adenylate cyclase/DNA-binding CsgD family transcriptional regulator
MALQRNGSEDRPVNHGLPSGTLTFVLADVLGLNRVQEQHPPLLPALLARLETVVDSELRAHGGQRAVEQEPGDSFVAVFARALDAAAFALDLNRSLQEQDWQNGLAPLLRMAVHTGNARPREDGRYIGETLNRCARVRALAHGGQVLVTSPTADLVGDQLGDAGFLKGLGVHQLRDLNRPERIAQLCGPGVPIAFPPLRSLDRLPHNLLTQPTTFLGRVDELTAVGALLDAHALVTVTGAGGCGKSRFAVQLGAELLEAYPDGVWLVELAPHADPEQVPKAVLDAFVLPERPGEPAGETVLEHLADSSLLLVLDNCEHLLDACVDLVDALRRRCPGVRILATSREPLTAAGEATFQLPSLGLPAHAGDVECESVALFRDRAALARPTLRIGPEHVDAVVEICTRLDGIPLALELAAARCRVMTLRQIADQLDDRFRLLTGGGRGRMARQRTLEASVDWSYALLEDHERAVLRRLSVFAGGFTLEAVGGVCGVEPDGDLPAVDVLAGLVDRSLVQVADEHGSPRYRLLETIRQYAGQKLADAGEGVTVRQRHAEWFAALAEECFAELLGPDVARADARLTADLDNLRTADDWAVETGQGELALRFAGLNFWLRRHSGEGLRRIGRALELPGGTPRQRAIALFAFAEVAWTAGDIAAAQETIAQSRRIAQDAGETVLLALITAGQGWGEWPLDEPQARDTFARGLTMLREADGPPFYIADNLLGHGLADLYVGDYADARRHLEEGVAVARACGSPVATCRGLVGLGLGLLFEGEFDAADAAWTEAVSLATGDGWGRLAASAGLAWVAALRGDTEVALLRADATVTEARQAGQMYAVAWGLLASTQAEFRAGPPHRAPPSRAEAEAVCGSQGIGWGVARCRALEAERLATGGDLVGAHAAAQGALDAVDSTMYAGHARGRVLLALARVLRADDEPLAAEDTAHRALGATSGIGARHELTEVLEFLAGLAAQADDTEEAVRLFAAAAAAREQLGYPRATVEEAAVGADLARASNAMDPAAFESAWQAGAAMTLPEAVAYSSRGRGTRKRPTTGWASLTPAEEAVVRLLVSGLRNAEIAARLFVSPQTVKSHLSHVFAKLGVSTRSELAVLAARRG